MQHCHLLIFTEFPDDWPGHLPKDFMTKEMLVPTSFESIEIKGNNVSFEAWQDLQTTTGWLDDNVSITYYAMLIQH